MKTIIATTLAAALATSAAGIAFAAPPMSSRPGEQTPPPAMNPTNPHAKSPRVTCASQFPTFSQLDTKGQGQITKKKATVDPKLEMNFKKVDTNHNGKVSRPEYTAWVKKQCGRGHTR